jgi:putative flippase GtrA
MDTSRGPFGRQVATFATIGVISTAAFAALYLALRPVLGPVGANAVALTATAIGNTAANRRITFGVRGGDRASMLRAQAAGLVALGAALAITTVAANVLALVAPNAGSLVELAVLVSANVVATVVRFVVLKAWIGREAPRLINHAIERTGSHS